MKILSIFTYQWWWFHLQWWLPAPTRRPFTYAMRDLYHKYPLIVISLGAIAIYLIGRYTAQISIWWVLSHIVVGFACMVLAHLFWGKRYQEGQQEDPTYLGEDDE